jgi:hypothetical protein
MLATMIQVETLLHAHAVVFELALARRGDELLKRLTVPLVYQEDDVYLVLTGEGSCPTMVEQAVDVALTALGIRAFVVPASRLRASDEAMVSFSDVKEVGDSVKSTIVGVFDNETFALVPRI